VIHVDDLLQAADKVVIVGYSFATADEHFNDLLRGTRNTTHVVIVNTDPLATAQKAARILAIDPLSLTEAKRGKWETWSSGRLTAVRAKADDVTEALLAAVAI
jgi:hypothetical protein